ncbi:hypothetical protein BX666DRAFT_1937533 [Dichotomocladium elegans]|nr:hypothetical protein BX666DRAFT_1937533 [Dichotomocladium elegans]
MVWNRSTDDKRRLTTFVGSLRKRCPQRPASVPSDIYISSKSNSTIVVKRVRRLMVNDKYRSVTLHGMGASLGRTITIAQSVQRALHDQVDLRPMTNSVTLVDDVIPDDMDKDIETLTRINSAIHVEIVAKPGLVALQQNVAPIASKPSRNRKVLK